MNKKKNLKGGEENYLYKTIKNNWNFISMFILTTLVSYVLSMAGVFNKHNWIILFSYLRPTSDT